MEPLIFILTILPPNGSYLFPLSLLANARAFSSLRSQEAFAHTSKENEHMNLKIIALYIGVFGISQAAFAEPTEEVLLGLDLNTKTLDLHVASGGCTKKDDFEIEVNKGFTGRPPYLVTVRRIRSDNCKKLMPEGVKLSFDRGKLGLDGLVEFTITNKIGNTSQHRVKTGKEEEAMTNDVIEKPVSTLIGKPSRVYKTGDSLTKDFIPDRVNIELNKSGEIVKIWMG